MIHSGILLLVLSMAFFPNVAAGTQNDPEISDAEGDSKIDFPCIDILSVWFDNETDATIGVTIKLKDLDDDVLPRGFCHYVVDFNDSHGGMGHYSAEASLRITESGVSVKYDLAFSDGNVYLILSAINGKIDFDNNTISMTIPKKKASCERALYDVRAESKWGPAVNILGYGGSNQLVMDLAPNDRYGRDYEFLFRKSLKNNTEENTTASTEPVETISADDSAGGNTTPGFETLLFALAAGVSVVWRKMKKC
jgi:hypothetical protein